MSPPTRLLPVAGLQLLLDDPKLVLFEITQYYHYQLELDITGLISTALLIFELGTTRAKSRKALTAIEPICRFGNFFCQLRLLLPWNITDVIYFRSQNWTHCKYVSFWQLTIDFSKLILLKTYSNARPFWLEE